MPYPHSEMTIESTYNFNEFCTDWGVGKDRDQFHRFTKLAELPSELTWTDWCFVWKLYRTARDAFDEESTKADALAARHW